MLSSQSICTDLISRASRWKEMLECWRFLPDLDNYFIMFSIDAVFMSHVMCILYHERRPTAQNSLNFLNFPHDVRHAHSLNLTHRTLLTKTLCSDLAGHVQINVSLMISICWWLYCGKCMCRSSCRSGELETWKLIEYE